MPTIAFSYKDFQNLLGKKLPHGKFVEMLLLYAKAEAGKYEEATGEITVELDDTNLPYLWCPEGLARLFQGILGIRKGQAKLKLSKGNYKIIAEESVKKVRPYITAFVAKGKKIDDYALKQLVQLQEKFCDNYGRKRQKVSTGLYSFKRLTFPVHYKAVPPESVKFTPLGFEKPLTLAQILKQHPKGQQYGWILKDSANYPILLDDKGEVLSLAPIINSSFTGRLEVGDSEMLFEATGTDEESINLAANIFAQNLAERGFEIYSVAIKQSGKSFIAPIMEQTKAKITPESVEQLTGLKLSPAQIKALLEKMGYEMENGQATLPAYRADYMHPVDIIEDVAIAYGFDKIAEMPLTSYTVGKKDSKGAMLNPLRKAIVGIGFQEIFSHILTDKNSVDGDAVELENFMSETYSAVRNSLLPQLLDVLAKNRHSEYPQKIFEEGIVATKKSGKIREWHSLALAAAHSKADFTEMKQYLSAFFAAAAIKFELRPTENATFIKGRVGSIIAGKKGIGLIGEISPAKLEELGIDTPVVAMEIDLSFLAY